MILEIDDLLCEFLFKSKVFIEFIIFFFIKFATNYQTTSGKYHQATMIP